MYFNQLIKRTRLTLQETQKQFGSRFDVGGVAVSLWESGDREAPYKVLEFVLDKKTKLCPKCMGKGFIMVKPLEKRVSGKI